MFALSCWRGEITVATFLNNDDAIWLKNVNADHNTIALLRQLPGGARIKIEVEGTQGEWERMQDGRDGRPTLGLKPVGRTLDFWKSMKPRRGEHLDFKIIDPRDTYLEAVQARLSEWDSAEDDVAFNDL
jgi:hypothetical protein